jgi:hypothetical protein
MIYRIVLILLATLLISACGGGAEMDTSNGSVSKVNGTNGTYRVIDNEAAVVCYVLINPYGAGVDCLPMDETRLKR